MRKLVSFIISLVILASAGFFFYRLTVHADTSLSLDEGTGTAVSDSSGTAAGTITGATWKPETECIAGRCLYFDGDGDLVSFGDNATLDFGATDSFTLVAWFRHSPTIAATQMIISKYNDAAGTDGGYQLYMDATGHIVFGIDSDQTSFPSDSVTSVNTFNDNLWHVAVAVKTTNSRMDLYVDGKADGTPDTSIVNATLANADTFYLGMDSDGSSSDWSGYLDEVKVLASTKTAAQVAALSVRPTNSSTTGTSASFGGDSSSLTQGLVGYWKLDEFSDGTGAVSRLDSSGNNNTLTDGNTTPSGAGKFGNAAAFAEANTEYLEIADATQTGLDLTGAMSVCTWFNRTSTVDNREYLVSKINATGNQRSYLMNIYDGVIYYQVNSTGAAGGGDSVSSGTVSNGVWYHVCGVYTGKQIQLYINGSLANTQAYSSGIFNSTAAFRIGSGDADVSPFTGIIDDTRVYNRALSPMEVESLYNWAPGPVAYYTFDNTANDASGYNHAASLGGGTAANMPVYETGKYGAALKFDGTDDYVKITNDPHFSTSNLTISLWYKSTNWGADINGVGLISKRSTYATMDWMLYYYPATEIRFMAGESAGISSSIFDSLNLNPSENVWHHIAVTKNGTTYSLYSDGVFLGSQVVAGAWVDSSDIYIGASTTTSNSFQGYIDNVRVYDYAQSYAQINQDMTTSTPSPLATLVSYEFNESMGTTLYDSGTANSAMNATSSGALWNLNGKVGSALQFNGTTSYVSSPKSAFMSATTQTYTNASWGGWVNPTTSAASKSLMIKNTEFKLETDTNSKANCAIYSTTWQTAAISNIALPVNAWSHVMCTYDGATISTYVNGKLEGTVAQTGVITSSATTGLNLGWNSAGGSYFAGLLDQIFVSPIALSPQQVRLVYNQNSSAVLGSLSDTSGLTGGSSASNSASASYCIPGDTATCSPPVAYYKLDENSGSSTFDSSGNNLTGSLTDPPAWTTGKYNNALQFNGSSNYVEITDTSKLSFIADGVGGDIPFTISAWVYPKGTGDMPIISKWSSDGYEWAFGMQGGGSSLLQLHLNDPGVGGSIFAYCSSCTIPQNQWTHVAVTYDGSDSPAGIKEYINGVAVSTTGVQDGDGYTNMNDTSSAIHIGAYLLNDATYEQLFNGKIDNIQIYRYARTPAQIIWDMNRGAPLVQFDFDEGANAVLNDTAPQPDRSIAPLTGTITPGDATGSNDTAADMWAGGINGKFNRALEFDGTNDLITIADTTRLTFGDTTTDRPFSISAWVYFNQSISSEIISKYTELTASPQREYRLYVSSSDYLTFYLYDESADAILGRRYSVAFPDNSWHHIVATYDGTAAVSGLKLYVDNKQVDDTNYTAGTYVAMEDTSANVCIGCYLNTSGAAANLFDGIMDDLRIYPYALTASQVKSLYNYGSAVKF